MKLQREMEQDNEGATLISREERQSCLITSNTFIKIIYLAIIALALVLWSQVHLMNVRIKPFISKIADDVEPSHVL